MGCRSLLARLPNLKPPVGSHPHPRQCLPDDENAAFHRFGIDGEDPLNGRRQMPQLDTDPDRFDFEKLFDVPNGEPLPSDSPNDDRTDAAMAARIRSYRQAEDLNWLLDGAEPSVREGGPAIDAGGGDVAGKTKGQPLRIGPAELPGIAGAAAMDMGMGAVEALRQVVGGMRDAVAKHHRSW